MENSAAATELLYLTDAKIGEFEATVTDVDETGAVVLDRTAFYPSGGGQPTDIGQLTSSVDGTVWSVTQVKKGGSGVRHRLESAERLPRPDENVTGVIDWDRRYRLMRMHSALHVLCGVVFREYGAQVTGGNMEPHKARMDFELDDLSPERVQRIEDLANAEIAANREIVVNTLPRDEAFAIPDLIRTKINLLPAGITQVRTVEIVGLDLQADGGTHVAHTGEIGGIRVIGTRSKGKQNKRLEIELVDGPDE